MTQNRRYDETEVREIFERAAREEGTRSPLPAAREGMTLEELIEVGREVGLPPDRIERAAAAVDIRPASGHRETSLGAPIALSRSVTLPRAPTEHEWHVLVAELREGRGVTGRMVSYDDAHEWSDGRLHVFVEPAATGHRLRLIARRRSEVEIVGLGGTAIVVALVVLVTGALEAAALGPVLEALVPSVLALLGAGSVAGRTLRLRRWGEETERAMARITGRMLGLMDEETP